MGTLTPKPQASDPFADSMSEGAATQLVLYFPITKARVEIKRQSRQPKWVSSSSSWKQSRALLDIPTSPMDRSYKTRSMPRLPHTSSFKAINFLYEGPLVLLRPRTCHKAYTNCNHYVTPSSLLWGGCFSPPLTDSSGSRHWTAQPLAKESKATIQIKEQPMP